MGGGEQDPHAALHATRGKLKESPTEKEKRKPRARGDEDERSREVEGPLEDAASVLHEQVDLEHSLLDEAELGTEEVPPALAETSEIEATEDEATATLEAESIVAPAPTGQNPDEMDPEELEERLEDEGEPAELLSLHDEEPLSEALLDEGSSLDEFEPDAVEDALVRGTEKRTLDEQRPALGRPLFQQVTLEGSPELPSPPEGPEEMPDVERFRHLLEDARARLEGLVDGFEHEGLRREDEQEDLSSLSAVDQHPADLGTETFVRERDLSLREQVEGELAEVEQALRRLEAGTYGRCEACGRPIDTDRLVAEPATRLCLDDQVVLERELAFEHREAEP
ncbi:MAG: TraR/DksA C4-type zinc finger protein [Actinomycetota bacterium]|nr:TraR/DksA C4-type zinc finger protein [Actinomycetota bacterium]